MSEALSAATHVTASIHDDGIVFFQTRSARIFAANRVGARMWQGIEQSLSRDALVAAIASENGISEATAQKDVERFVAQLDEHGLLAKER